MIASTQSEKNVALYSKKPLGSWMLSVPPDFRDQLIRTHCGTSSGYILKRNYTYDYELAPRFKLKIAVGLDKASQGQVDFRDHIEDRDAIDWRYVHKVLGQRLRAEAAAAKATAEEAAS